MAKECRSVSDCAKSHRARLELMGIHRPCAPPVLMGMRFLGGHTSFPFLSKCVTAANSAKMQGAAAPASSPRVQYYMVRADASKGCVGLAGYPRLTRAHGLNHRFGLLACLFLNDFANSSRNLASARRRVTSYASRVAMIPSESRVSLDPKTPDLTGDCRAETAAFRKTAISARSAW